MKTALKNITVGELFEGYVNRAEEGVRSGPSLGRIVSEGGGRGREP